MKKLVVFMIDALCACDIEEMKKLPHFGSLIAKGSYVSSILPVMPALTYCCHTSILTGKYVDGHGIHNNEQYTRGCQKSEVWFGLKKDVKAKTLLDYANELGLTTCSIAWPVSAGADYTYNWPMIVPYHYSGDHPEDYLKDGNASANLMEKYFWKYGRFQKGKDASLDLLTMALAPDIIEDYGQPDVMLIKMCDLDTVRHQYGVYASETKDQLKKHDTELGVIIEALKKFGDLDNTNFVIMGDHGQTDINDVVNMNKLLEDAGFIRLDANGKMVDCDCLAHTAGLSCFIELKDPTNLLIKEKVHAFLESLKNDSRVALDYVYDEKDMKEVFHLEGPFDFVIESKNPVAFSDYVGCQSAFMSTEPGDHKIGAATHGGSCKRQETTLFIASGPSVKQGVVLPCREMVDEAVTMAKMIGFEMPDTDGKLMTEILK